MKNCKYILIVALLLVNLVFAQPSFADRPKFTKNPDYIALTQDLNKLQTTKESQAQLEGYTPEQIEARINELQLQKYAFESGIDWGQCSNQTGKTSVNQSKGTVAEPRWMWKRISNEMRASSAFSRSIIQESAAEASRMRVMGCYFLPSRIMSRRESLEIPLPRGKFRMPMTAASISCCRSGVRPEMGTISATGFPRSVMVNLSPRSTLRRISEVFVFNS